MQTNIQNFINLINQIVLHLNRIPETLYSEKISILGGSSIGEHVRHIYNFPERLLHGLQSGIINYDKRTRNTNLESNKDYAIESLLEQTKYILNLIHYENSKLVLETGTDENKTLRMDTNLKRELHYITEHTIHHMAILRIGFMHSFPDMEIDSSFGFAYSTIEYKKLIR